MRFAETKTHVASHRTTAKPKPENDKFERDNMHVHRNVVDVCRSPLDTWHGC
jgi:hypothetical protein